MSERDRDDDEIDDASLSSMRSVWLTMRDEEPPAAGMSALLAAAAAKATEMQPAPPWWRRMFAQLRRPPVLAFATVMLLIGGAVVITRNESTMKVEEEPAAAPSALRAQEPARESPVAREPPVAPEPVTGGAPPQVTPRPKQTKPRPAKVDDDSSNIGPNEPSRARRFDAPEEAKPGFVGESQSVDATAPAIVDDRRQAPTLQAEVAPTEQLARQAETAAARGDCAAVKVIVARLRAQDEAFYRSRLGTNAAVTRCF